MALYALDNNAPNLIGKECWVAQNASVIGNVTLGEGSSVWFGATLRGDNEPIVLGEACNVQEQSVLHTDWGFPLCLGNFCTVGHGAILHGCTLGDRVLIGMGAIVLNGAVIGEDSLVGAGALVTEGKVFPSRSLIIGSPAKAVRELKPQEITNLYQSACDYRDNARRFQKSTCKIK